MESGGGASSELQSSDPSEPPRPPPRDLNPFGEPSSSPSPPPPESSAGGEPRRASVDPPTPTTPPPPIPDQAAAPALHMYVCISQGSQDNIPPHLQVPPPPAPEESVTQLGPANPFDADDDPDSIAAAAGVIENMGPERSAQPSSDTLPPHLQSPRPRASEEPIPQLGPVIPSGGDDDADGIAAAAAVIENLGPERSAPPSASDRLTGRRQGTTLFTPRM